jgi:hypothetical protein
MIERCQDMRFALEAHEAIGIEREQIREDFQRDVAVQLQITRPIDLAHTTGADHREDFVGADPGPWGETHIRGCPDYSRRNAGEYGSGSAQLPKARFRSLPCCRHLPFA